MVCVMLANGFEEVEALTVVDLLRRAGIETVTVGVKTKIISGAHKINDTADITIGELDLCDIRMLVLPGGMPGAKNLQQNKKVIAAVSHCAEANKPIAAICAAPMILGELGLLNGKKAVCFPSFKKHLKNAEITDNNVETDGKIITAVGAGAAFEFTAHIIKMLKGREEANRILEEIKCQVRI